MADPSQLFDTLDANGDGVLSRDEFVAGYGAAAENRSTNSSSGPATPAPTSTAGSGKNHREKTNRQAALDKAMTQLLGPDAVGALPSPTGRNGQRLAPSYASPRDRYPFNPHLSSVVDISVPTKSKAMSFDTPRHRATACATESRLLASSKPIR
eukprot:SAG11_NODE_1272_length_5334_cov_11.636676_4_plen_154_part_00